MPNSTRIEAVLKTETEIGRDRAFALRARPRPATRTPGVSREDAIEMFLEELHRLPTHKEVKKYAQPKGFSLTRETMSHPNSIEIVRRRRVADTDGSRRLSRSWHGEPAIAGACAHQLLC